MKSSNQQTYLLAALRLNCVVNHLKKSVDKGAIALIVLQLLTLLIMTNDSITWNLNLASLAVLKCLASYLSGRAQASSACSCYHSVFHKDLFLDPSSLQVTLDMKPLGAIIHDQHVTQYYYADNSQHRFDLGLHSLVPVTPWNHVLLT